VFDIIASAFGAEGDVGVRFGAFLFGSLFIKAAYYLYGLFGVGLPYLKFYSSVSGGVKPVHRDKILSCEKAFNTFIFQSHSCDFGL